MISQQAFSCHPGFFSHEYLPISLPAERCYIPSGTRFCDLKHCRNPFPAFEVSPHRDREGLCAELPISICILLRESVGKVHTGRSFPSLSSAYLVTSLVAGWKDGRISMSESSERVGETMYGQGDHHDYCECRS